MSNNKSEKLLTDISISRRNFVKKTVYSAPTLVVLGTLPEVAYGGWGNDSIISPKSSATGGQSSSGTKNSLNNSQSLNGN